MEEQLSLFEASYEKPVLPKRIRLIEFFAGIGAQAKALEMLDLPFEHHRTCEWSWQSIIAYNAIHFGGVKEEFPDLTYEEVLDRIEGVSNDYNKPMTRNELKRHGEKWAREVLGAMAKNHNLCPNVSKLHASDLGIDDGDAATYLLTYSFPCFTGDQMLLTKDEGYIPFKEAKVGQLVLGKDGKWHPIAKLFDNGTRETAFVEAMGFATIHTTPDHKFWVRKKRRIGHKGIRTFSRPDWVHAKDLSKDCYLGVPVIEEETPFHTDDLRFWELIGIYVGDGWIHQKAVFLSGNERKRDRITDLLNGLGIHHTCHRDSAHCWRIRIPDRELLSFVEENIGSGSKTKRIPYPVLALPKPQLESFLNGYVSADGCRIKGKTQITTTNGNVAYSVALIVNKLYHRVCCVYEVKTPDTHVIEGRTVNQSDWYQLRFKETNGRQDKAFYEDGFLWYPFKKYREAEPDHVYDIEVEEAHSFTLNGCIVSNCQDLSNAGTLKGMEKGSGTRSGLLWEVERILNECKELDCLPQVLLMENVPGVCGTANLKPWNEWLDALEKLGYTNYWKILNAKDYGIPQNRRRCFMVSILGNYSYSFPRKFTPKFVLRDFASKEEAVPEEYYLSDKVVAMFQRINRKHEERGNGFRFEPKDGNGVSNTITTREGERTENTYLEVPMPSEDSEEISTPSVVNHLEIPSATKKGYMEAYPGDGILPNWKGARGTVQRGGCPTILTSPDTIAIVVEKKDDEV